MRASASLTVEPPRRVVLALPGMVFEIGSSCESVCGCGVNESGWRPKQVMVLLGGEQSAGCSLESLGLTVVALVKLDQTLAQDKSRIRLDVRLGKEIKLAGKHDVDGAPCWVFLGLLVRCRLPPWFALQTAHVPAKEDATMLTI